MAMAMRSQESGADMMAERIFLIGFMGTGKTSVGKQLAEALNWSRYDTDQEIETREGRSIPEIFAAESEAYFRQVESEVLRELSAEPQAVITTGGGAVLSSSNCELMRTSGLVVCLTADLDEIVRRVQQDANRPLLQGDDLKGRVEQLLAARSGRYDFAHLTLNTTGREIAGIVEDIVQKRSESVQ